jgi:hypothetical protein
MHGDCTKPAIALMGIDPLPDSDLSTAAKDEPGDASHVYVKRQARSLSHAVETIFNYDPNGSLMSDGVFNYTYDAANRLNQAERIPVGTTTATALSDYIANGLNQRVVMTTGTTAPVTTSLMVYDEGGHVIGHYVNVAKVRMQAKRCGSVICRWRSSSRRTRSTFTPTI